MLNDAITAVLPEQLSNCIVWHYTSPAVARSILTQRALWATSAQTMNDRSEVLYGMSLVKAEWDVRSQGSASWERIDRWIQLAELALRGERLSDSYILCASTEKDSIQQWDRYGICEIGIATDGIMTKVPQPNSAGGRLGATFTTGWRPVIYSPNEQTAHIARLFDVLEELCKVATRSRDTDPGEIDETGIECVLSAIVYLKDPGFYFEKEVRLYGRANATGALVIAHNSSFGPSRHILVCASTSDDGDDLPIRELRLGDVTPDTSEHAELLRTTLRAESHFAELTLVKSSFRKSSTAHSHPPLVASR